MAGYSGPSAGVLPLFLLLLQGYKSEVYTLSAIFEHRPLVQAPIPSLHSVLSETSIDDSHSRCTGCRQPSSGLVGDHTTLVSLMRAVMFMVIPTSRMRFVLSRDLVWLLRILCCGTA